MRSALRNLLLLNPRRAVAAPWWLAGGVSPSVWAGVYQWGPTTAQSYSNRVNPGTNNLALGVAPALGVDGLQFNGSTQYLTTGIVPTTGWSWIVLYSNHNLATNTALFGSGGAGNTVFGTFPAQSGTSTSYRNGSNAVKATMRASGVLASTPGKGYYNGVDDGVTVGAWGGAGTQPIAVGAYNANGTISNYSNTKIKALGIANTALTADQIAALSSALLALPDIAIDGQIIFDGDSRTAGTGAAAGLDYPSQLMPLVGVNNQKQNFGVGGQTQAQMNSDAASQIDTLYNAALARNIVICCGGHNDLNAAATGADTYALIASYVAARKAAGFRVAVGTVPKSSALTSGEETERQALNALILANSAGANVVVDVASAAQLQNTADSTYFTDGVHFTAAGYAVWASAFATGIASLL